MYVHCLHWLMSTDLLFQSAFADHVNLWLVKWHQTMAPIWLWEPDMPTTVSAHLPNTCSWMLALFWMQLHIFATLYSTTLYLHHLASLLKLFPPPTPPLSHFHPPPYMCWPNMNSMKKSSKTGENLPLSTCQVSCIKVNKLLGSSMSPILRQSWFF